MGLLPEGSPTRTCVEAEEPGHGLAPAEGRQPALPGRRSSQRRAAHVAEDTEAWSRQLDEYHAGALHPRTILQVGRTPTCSGAWGPKTCR
jgi:hypothetical protein